jgi:hypothetical protein
MKKSPTNAWFLTLALVALWAGKSLTCADAVPAANTVATAKLKEIPTLLAQNKYEEAHTILSQLREEYPKSIGLERLAKSLSPLWRLLPRHLTAYTELSVDDRQLVDGWNKDALSDATFAKLDAVQQFTLRNSDYPHGWVLQAYLALKLDKEPEGREAAQRLIDLGGANSLNPTFRALLVQLDEKGWLPDPAAANPVGPATTDSDPSAPNSQIQAKAFLCKYIEAYNSAAPDDELSFYAPSVRYFDQGMEDLDAIKANIARYRAKYPVRVFHLHGDFTMESIDPTSYLVTCSLDYRVRDCDQTPQTGMVSDQIAVQKQGDGWKIIGIENLTQN